MFPTEAEKARSRSIEDYYALYCGKFGQVLRYFRTERERRNQLEVIQNTAGMISRVFADLMFSEEVKIGTVDKRAKGLIDGLFMANDLNVKLYESAITQSYAGRAYLELGLVDGRAVINELNPAIVYPQFSTMFGGGEPSKVIIAWEPKIGGEPYRFIKTHTPGLITYELAKIDGAGKILGYADLGILDPSIPQLEETGLDFIPVYTINNVKTARESEGVSDYADLLSLFEELTRVQSQIATQLKKHGDAKMAVPPGVLDERGRVKVESTEMFEVKSGTEDGLTIPQYITNSNPLIEAAFRETEKLIEAIARVAEVSTILIDWNVSGGAERVGALKLRLLRTLSKVKRKTRPYDKVLREIICDALAWEGTANLTPLDLDVQFGDGLPTDTLADAQEQTLLYGAGLQSRKDAMRMLYGLEGEALDAKEAEIEQEQKDKLEAAMQGTPSFSFGGA